jgi:broad specificity phosphatase PhoE
MQRRTVLAAAAWPLALRAQPAATVLLLRHAQTEPGIGDPPGFVPGQCNTQRNLSDPGREQARKLGAALRARGLTPQRVRSSRWCRCLDTARLAFDSVEPWPALDSFFGDRGRVDAQTAELRRALAALPAGRVEAWVTHQVNISALTGGGAAMGEVLLLRAGEVIERIITAP